MIVLFERIESFFRRLETYIGLPRTTEMMEMIVTAMTEILIILSLATREIEQGNISELTPKAWTAPFDLPFIREIPEDANRKIGYQGCAAEAGQPNARRKSDGGCTRSEGRSRCG